LLLVAVGHRQSMAVLALLLCLYSIGLVSDMVDGIVVIGLEEWSLKLQKNLFWLFADAPH
jgi:hypothetical protein